MANILLIEPDRLLAETYRQALESAGHSVSVCATALSAIMAADQSTPDLVVLEIQLVEHSGIEFLYEFRSYTDWQTVPVIVLTQVPPSEFLHSRQILSQELGVKTYLYKPKTNLHQLIEATEQELAVPA